MLVLADAGNWKVGAPGLTYSLRGLAGGRRRAARARRPGALAAWPAARCPIPVIALARLLASLVDEHGDRRVRRLLGRLRGARPPPSARRIAGSDDEAGAPRARGACAPAWSSSATRRPRCYERLWLRPTLTVIGIDGHPIKGSSNQIVAERRGTRQPARSAAARIPTRARRGAARAPRAARPVGARAHDHRRSTACPRGRLRADRARRSTRTERALRAGFGVEPVSWASAASIPFVGPFADAFGGIPALLLGPADPGSRIHGEDESLHLGDWHKLIESEVRLLAELANEILRGRR